MIRNISRKIAIATVLALSANTTAYAIAVPYTLPAQHPQTQFANKLYGYVTRLDIDADGKGVASAVFSYGERWAAERGVGVVISFVDGEGHVVHAVRLGAVVQSAQFNRHARRVDVKKEFALSGEQRTRIASVSYKWEQFPSPAQVEWMNRKMGYPTASPPVFNVPIINIPLPKPL